MLKKIVEKLLYKSEVLLTKCSVEQYYSEKFDSLTKDLTIKMEECEKLTQENSELKSQINSMSPPAKKIPSKVLILESPPQRLVKTEIKRLPALVKASFNIHTVHKLTLQQEFINKLTPFTDLVKLANRSLDMNNVITFMENSYRNIIGCDSMIIIRKNPKMLQYSSRLFGQLLNLQDMGKLPYLNSVLVNNNANLDDDLVHMIHAEANFTVSNYLLIPRILNINSSVIWTNVPSTPPYLMRKSDLAKQIPVEEFLLFLNKRDKKKNLIPFTKADETIGILGCYEYNFICSYFGFMQILEKEREIKLHTFAGIAELLSCVFFKIEILKKEINIRIIYSY